MHVSSDLTAPRLLMVCLDDVAKDIDDIANIVDQYGEKILSLDNIALSDTQQLRQWIEQLPPERAAALVRAIEHMSQLIIESERDQDIAKILERRFKLISYIRTYLHLALEDDAL